MSVKLIIAFVYIYMEMTNDRLTEAILITMITVFSIYCTKHEEELYYGLSEVVLFFSLNLVNIYLTYFR